MKIHTLDPIWTECDEAAADFIRNYLTYDEVRFERRFGRTVREVERVYLVQGWEYGRYLFLTGYVPRVLRYLKKHRARYKYTTDIPVIEFDEPDLGEEKLRDYQHDLVMKAVESGRGTILSPTGSGKSYIIFGVISCFSQENILLLVHSIDLVQQLYNDLESKGFDPGIYYGAKKEIKRITVGSVQSYHKIASEYIDHWDVVIVDEGHHVTSPLDGQYYRALAYCAAPARFAFTATKADNEGQQMGLEGLIGPVIGELTIAEGHDLGFLATPEIIFKISPIPHHIIIPDRATYTEIYTAGVSANFNRHMRVIDEAEKEVNKGGTVLILVKHIRHAEEISEYLSVEHRIVKGSVKKDDRHEIKESMKSGELACVIATSAWIEGIDIPNLTMVVNAAGGKSERETLQKLGRGLRKTKNKTKVKIIDFMDVIHTDRDPFARQRAGEGKKHILHKQSVERWKIYEEQGWEPKIV